MKKIIISAFLLFVFITPSFAIDWMPMKSVSGNMFALDKDSIHEENGYYFFNLKIFTNGIDDIVVTMQSKTTSPFCKRIEHYKLSQYEALAGNYKNITRNMTDSLEPVPYQSSAYAAYKKVKELKGDSKPQIEIQ